jgi:hypothetical protein
VLRGIRNNDLYILTHPEYEHETLIASIPRDVHVPETLMQMVRLGRRKSIYFTERSRQRLRRRQSAK